jgi:hypothetical protein
MTSSNFLTRVTACAMALIAVTLACGGTTSSSTTSTSLDGGASPDASGVTADAAVPSSDSGDADAAPSACAQVTGKYGALGSTAAYLTCSTSSDCTIVSSDICYDTPTLALNAAGVAEANALEGQFNSLDQCGIQDCGSGGGGGVSAACESGKCAANVGGSPDAGP